MLSGHHWGILGHAPTERNPRPSTDDLNRDLYLGRRDLRSPDARDSFALTVDCDLESPYHSLHRAHACLCQGYSTWRSRRDGHPHGRGWRRRSHWCVFSGTAARYEKSWAVYYLRALTLSGRTDALFALAQFLAFAPPVTLSGLRFHGPDVNRKYTVANAHSSIIARAHYEPLSDDVYGSPPYC